MPYDCKRQRYENYCLLDYRLVLEIAVYMEKYLLVGLVLKDGSNIDKITKLEEDYFYNGRNIKYSDLVFRVSHFRVLELNTLSLLDISVNEYCTSDFEIYGIGKCVREYYKELSEDWETIKSIKLNVNCITEDALDSRRLNWGSSSDSDIDKELAYNNVPVIYNNEPVYGTSIVGLSDYGYGGNNSEVRFYVDYITGEVLIYLERLLVYGNDLTATNRFPFAKSYSIESGWKFVERNSNDEFEHINLLLNFGYNLGNGYISNGEIAIVYRVGNGDVIIIPSNVKTVATFIQGYNCYGMTFSIVLPPKAKLKPINEFNFSSNDNNDIRLVLSDSTSFADLKEMAEALGSHTYGLTNRDEAIERIEEDCGIKLEFY